MRFIFSNEVILVSGSDEGIDFRLPTTNNSLLNLAPTPPPRQKEIPKTTTI
jgi:hypothetical protein